MIVRGSSEISRFEGVFIYGNSMETVFFSCVSIDHPKKIEIFQRKNSYNSWNQLATSLVAFFHVDFGIYYTILYYTILYYTILS